MVLHAGIGLVVVSTKSVPLQLKESPFTFFSTHLSRLVKILRQCAVGKTRKKPFARCPPRISEFDFIFPKVCVSSGSSHATGMANQLFTYRVGFHKKTLNRLFY